MKFFLLILFMGIFSLKNATYAQYSMNDNWHNNPLGFEPLNLHTSMGFLVPAAAMAICIAATKRDSTLRNRLSLNTTAGCAWGYKYPNTMLSQTNLAVSYLLRKWLAVGTEAHIYFMRDNYNNTTGTATRLFARFYMANRKDWRLFFESGGGLIYCIKQFPMPTPLDMRLGTHLNGTTRYGVHGEIRFTERTSITAGVCHVHISNGNSKGVERNPSHDSNGFVFGLSHVFQ